MRISSLLVLPIITVMGASQAETVSKTYINIENRVRAVVTRHEMRTIQTAVFLEYISDNTREVESDFSAFVRTIAHSDTKDVANDAWGSPYEIVRENYRYVIYSNGPDGVPETNDDIVATVKTI